MLYTPFLEKGTNKKFARFFSGPYRITAIYEQNAVIVSLQNEKKQQRVHLNRLKKYYGAYVLELEKVKTSKSQAEEFTDKRMAESQKTPLQVSNTQITKSEEEKSWPLQKQQETQPRYNLRKNVRSPARVKL